MFRKLAVAAVAVSVLAAAGPAAASTNLLVNGDFEDGVVGGAYDHYQSGIPVGWTFGFDVVDVIENGYYQGADPALAVLLTAQSGTHFADMNGAGSTGIINQIVTGLAAGDAVELSLWTGQWAQNSHAGVTWSLYDGVTDALLASGNANTDGTPWTRHTLSAVVGGSGSVRVELAGLATYQAGSGVDNVRLSLAGDVPEPTVWGLMIVGFGGIGAMLRRRREAAVPA